MKRQNLITLTGLVLLVLGILSFSKHHQNENIIETFTFSSNGKDFKAKIYLPEAYKSNHNLPAIFIIDFTEQHFKIATDEFEQVIKGTQQLEGGALVVSLEKIADIDAKPDAFKKHYAIFKNMAEYIHGKYTNNTSRTFIGKGSESGIVLMSLLLEYGDEVFDNFIATDPGGGYKIALTELLEKKGLPNSKTKKKLHFSFSTSNNYQKCTKIINLIKEADYPWLSFESVYYKNNTYENAYPIVFSEGIKFVFETD